MPSSRRDRRMYGKCMPSYAGGYTTVRGGLVTPEERLNAAKEKQFSPLGKHERVRKALAALKEAVIDSQLDADTLRWVAEGTDLEEPGITLDTTTVPR